MRTGARGVPGRKGSGAGAGAPRARLGRFRQRLPGRRNRWIGDHEESPRDRRPKGRGAAVGLGPGGAAAPGRALPVSCLWAHLVSQALPGSRSPRFDRTPPPRRRTLERGERLMPRGSLRPTGRLVGLPCNRPPFEAGRRRFPSILAPGRGGGVFWIGECRRRERGRGPPKVGPRINDLGKVGGGGDSRPAKVPGRKTR